jgi:hypothetical protein
MVQIELVALRQKDVLIAVSIFVFQGKHFKYPFIPLRLFQSFEKSWSWVLHEDDKRQRFI